MTKLTIGELAGRVGSTADALRYYERLGLLPKADRSPAGYRLFGDDAIAQVRFIKGAQRLGLRLDEISELLTIRQEGVCACGRTRQLLEERLAQLDTELAGLVELRDEIRNLLDGGPVPADDQCTGSRFAAAVMFRERR